MSRQVAEGVGAMQVRRTLRFIEPERKDLPCQITPQVRLRCNRLLPRDRSSWCATVAVTSLICRSLKAQRIATTLSHQAVCGHRRLIPNGDGKIGASQKTGAIWVHIFACVLLVGFTSLIRWTLPSSFLGVSQAGRRILRGQITRRSQESTRFT